MKINIATRTNLNEKMIKESFEYVEHPDDADIIIAQSSINFNWDLNKVVYVAVEPPLADHRLKCYSLFNKFHTVITHNPDVLEYNQFPFTISDEPQYYPSKPNPSVVPFLTREDTKIGNRGVFYAGMIGSYEDVPNSFSGINLTKVRRKIGEFLNKNSPNSKIIGIGWNNQKTKVGNWRVDKQKEIKESDCDFVLALENTMLPNYLYEKIWDGFASDRVVLYLGDPLVERHIPLNCFIDLRKYFNKVTGEFDCEEMFKKINEMTQTEYDSILKNSRKFRETAGKNHSKLQNELTKFIIKRIKEND